MKNDKVLFCLKVLKSMLATFVDSFFMLYFLQLSNRNIVPIGIYKLVAVITIFMVIFFVRNICKTKYRLNLLRIGIVLHFVYFFAIIYLREKMIDHIILVGMLYGLEEGFYYSVYNMIESDGVTNRDRKKFMGMYTFVNAIVSILVPLVFGSYIYANGFLSSLIIVLIVVVIRILLSSKLKDTNLPSQKKTDLRRYRNLIKKYPIIHVFYEWDTLPMAADIESKFIESGISNVILNEKKNFSHGRYTSLYNQNFALVINLERYESCHVSEYDQKLSEFLKERCKEKAAQYIKIGKSCLETSEWNIYAMAMLPYLITSIGEELGIDISKPLKPFPSEAKPLFDYKGEF